jgi:hypothetical protein
VVRQSSNLGFSVEQASRNVHIVRVDLQNRDQWVFLRSDAHHDSMECDRELEKRHLNLALERNALIIDAGDLFDAMQGKGDKRSSYSALREEHKRTDYFNAIVEEAASFYGPYAKNWVVFGYGNHETAVRTKLGIDLLANLTTLLNHQQRTSVTVGGYTGYVRFRFHRGGTRLTSLDLKYDHGSGGGGPVTGGVINAQRRAAFIWADFVMTGHVHERWMRELMKERVSPSDRITHTSQIHLCCASYKDGYGDGHGGWETERGMPPKPKGGWWIRFFLQANEVVYELIKA